MSAAIELPDHVHPVHRPQACTNDKTNTHKPTENRALLCRGNALRSQCIRLIFSRHLQNCTITMTLSQTNSSLPQTSLKPQSHKASNMPPATSNKQHATSLKQYAFNHIQSKLGQASSKYSRGPSGAIHELYQLPSGNYHRQSHQACQ